MCVYIYIYIYIYIHTYIHTYTYTMEYYSSTKKNEIMSFVTTWMDLDIFLLSEVNQRQISYDIIYRWNLKKTKDTNELIYKIEINPQT